MPNLTEKLLRKKLSIWVSLWHTRVMLTYYFRSTKDSALTTRGDIKPGTWVHAERPTEQEMRVLVEECGLEEGLVQDALDFYEVPRLEEEGDVVYLYTRFPATVDGTLGTAPILIAITKKTVISVTGTPTPFLQPYRESKVTILTTQRPKLFLHIIQGVIKSFERHLIAIRKEVQRNRVAIDTISNKDIVRLVSLESTLNDFVSGLTPTYTALHTVLSGKKLALHEEDKDMVEDLELQSKQVIESAKANLKTIQNIRSAYTAIMSNNLNDVIKLLTALTIILTIPTILGSLYGMNVPLPFSDSPHAFFAITLGTTLLMAIAALIFSRKDWM
jgi:magnesium transporter